MPVSLLDDGMANIYGYSIPFSHDRNDIGGIGTSVLPTLKAKNTIKK